MTEYVIGFLFDGMRHVALIHKRHPKWQAGRINGIGGHIESDETPEHAMTREFQEETGCLINTWRKFATVHGTSYCLHLFTATQKVKLKSTTDERVFWSDVTHLPFDCLPNLSWMIPMANYKLPIMADIIHESPEC